MLHNTSPVSTVVTGSPVARRCIYFFSFAERGFLGCKLCTGGQLSSINCGDWESYCFKELYFVSFAERGFWGC